MGKLGKHDHKLTNLLKGGIFSLIMLAPLIAIGVRCLYVVNNKNAYESYSNYEIQDTILVTETNNLLIENRDYIWTYTTNFTNSTDYVYFNSISEWVKDLAPNYTIVAFRLTGNANFILKDNNGTDHANYNYFTNANTKKTFNFNYKNTNQTNIFITSGKLLLIDYKKGTLDNVFEYSLKQLKEQSTFNWVQNTAIYVPLNAMCSGLGITESAIPILLCYWSLMTAIYIVFDIIIYLFTKMTHFIGTN